MAEWVRVKALFEGALDQPAAARERWLRDAAGADLELLHEAQGLLDAHATAGDFLEQPAIVDAADIVAANADEAPFVPGAILGSYRIVEEIGRGGMGVVYLAEDLRLGRRVALKALPATTASEPTVRERLRREARAAATISHPAVATVYALEEIDNHIVITSEYVRGHTLRRELQHGPLSERRALAVATEIARALSAAHDAGVVHRDLKPENVLLTADDSVKVVDFGIAHLAGDIGTPRLTIDGGAVGTPAYMAPEQLRGGPVDARVDVYAAGVVFAEMIDGRKSALGPIIQRCLQAAREARFTSGRDLLQAIEVSRVPAGHGLWWWQFHQAAAALTYWLMVIAAWHGRGLIGGAAGRTFFIVALAAVIVAANLRLHLWFTSRFYRNELKWLRGRVGPWIHAADWLFAAVLIAGGALIGVETSPVAILLLAFGLGAAVAFLVIEPATTRAAFRKPPGMHHGLGSTSPVDGGENR